MRKLIISILLIQGYCLSSSHAQQLTGSIQVQYVPTLAGSYISGSLDDWESGNQSVSCRICASQELPACSVNVRVFHNDTLLAHVAVTLRVPRGCSLYGPETFNVSDYLSGRLVDFGNADYIKYLVQYSIRTRNLAAGRFRVCMDLYESESNSILLDEDCPEVTISGFQPPNLIRPIDITLPSTAPVLFQWSPSTPSFGFIPDVNLEVYEVNPFQTPVQAIQANIPLISQQVVGTYNYYWTPMDLPILPSDSMNIVWRVVSNELLDDLGSNLSSEIGTFTLFDPRMSSSDTNPTPSPPCSLKVDAGPDQIYYAGQPQGVTIGTPDPSHASFVWASDPPGVVGYSSQITVAPLTTTHYVLYKDSADCQVWDDVWVFRKDPTTASITVDQCGNLIANAILDSNRVHSGHAGICIRDSLGFKLKCGNATYRFKGAVVSSPNIIVETPCDRPLPQSLSTIPPADPQAPTPSYLWSNGTVGPNLVATEAGNYSVTVTAGPVTSTASAFYQPHAPTTQLFPDFSVTTTLRRGDPNSQFLLREILAPQPTNASSTITACRITVMGPGGFRRVLNGSRRRPSDPWEVRWDGAKKEGGRYVPQGTYYWEFDAVGCSDRGWVNSRQYRFRDVLGPSGGGSDDLSPVWIGRMGRLEVVE